MRQPCTRRSAWWSGLGALALGLTLVGPAWGQTDDLPPDDELIEVPFGLVGVAWGQTARLSVSAVPIPGFEPSPDYPPNPCYAVLQFFDADGAPVTDRLGRPVRRRAALEPGETASLDLPAVQALRGSLRTSVRASVLLPPNPCALLVPTLEVFNTWSGRTEVLYPNPGPPDVLYPNPGPPNILAYGTVGLALGQVARVNVSWPDPGPPGVPPDPIVVALQFVDVRGEAILDPDGQPVAAEVRLLPGQSGWLDLPAVQVLGDARRAQVRAVVHFPPNPIVPPTTTVEVFDAFSGRTQVLYPEPGPPGIGDGLVATE